MANVITTVLKLNADQLRSGLKGAQASIRETDGLVNKAKAGWSGAFAAFAASPVAVGAATAAVGAFAASSVKAASDLNESINAVNVTFSESADKILEFGDNAAKSVGLAQAQFNQLATPLGSILKNAGFGLDEVADKTITLTQRAADMASVFNTDVSDALSAIQAGLRGEQDPLEKYGVGLSAAKVEARALADTGKATAKALTDQEKQLARVEIILDQTNQTAGDFANTSDGLANKTRILNAELTDFKAKVGEQLLPVLGDAAEGGILLLDALDKLQAGLEDFKGTSGSSFNPFTSGIGFALNAVKDLNQAWQGGADAAERLEPRLEALAQAHQDGADAAKAQADATSAATDEVVDLGDKSANTGSKIGDMAGALDDAQQRLADLNDEARNNALDALANAAQAVGDAVDAAFQGVRDNLDIQQLLDDITDQFGAVKDAGKDATDPEGVRKYRTEVRRLREMLLDLLGDLKNVSAQDKIKLTTEIERGSVDDLFRILGQLSKGVVVPVSFDTAPTPAFTAANISIPQPGSNAIPSLDLLNFNPQPANNSRTTIIYPVGSSPTSTAIDQRVYDSRNGPR